MDEKTFLIVAVLIGVIQIILILSVVHISAKSDEMANELRKANEALNKIAKSLSSSQSPSSAPIVRNSGNTWNCPKCGKSNPSSSRVCKDCGYEK